MLAFSKVLTAFSLYSLTFLILLDVESSKQQDRFVPEYAAMDRKGRIYSSAIANQSYSIAKTNSGYLTYSEWIESTPPVPPNRSLAHP